MTFHTLILILHVLGACVVFSVVFFSVVLTVKPGWSEQTMDRLHFIGSFGKWASLWQLATGLYLASSDWSELRSSTLFWTKIAIYVIEGTFAGMLIEKKLKAGTEQRPQGIKAIMLTHIVLITAIVAIGVMIVEQ